MARLTKQTLQHGFMFPALTEGCANRETRLLFEKI